LVIDACAALHLKQLDLLWVVDEFLNLGASLVSTSKIEQEMTSMSLSQAVGSWKARERCRECGPDA
jgi:hypothetical protein